MLSAVQAWPDTNNRHTTGANNDLESIPMVMLYKPLHVLAKNDLWLNLLANTYNLSKKSPARLPLIAISKPSMLTSNRKCLAWEPS